MYRSDEAHEMFDKHDTNRSGDLDLAELRAMFGSMRLEEQLGVTVQQRQSFIEEFYARAVHPITNRVDFEGFAREFNTLSDTLRMKLMHDASQIYSSFSHKFTEVASLRVSLHALCGPANAHDIPDPFDQELDGGSVRGGELQLLATGLDFGVSVIFPCDVMCHANHRAWVRAETVSAHDVDDFVDGTSHDDGGGDDGDDDDDDDGSGSGGRLGVALSPTVSVEYELSRGRPEERLQAPPRGG